jgi:hypothetical protein
MRGLKVNVLCRNYRDDRIIPRMSRYLRDGLGWGLSDKPDPACDVLFLSAYFEASLLNPWPDVPVMAYFTHREEEPKGNAKARLFDAMAAKVDHRVATCQKYAQVLALQGSVTLARAPLERERFVPVPHPVPTTPTIGFSGYTYRNQRKGEDLVQALLGAPFAGKVNWTASGRGWPVPTVRYTWADMPAFYQALDLLVVPSRVEGIPMPPLEALACGVPVVVPTDVGLLDELPDIPGIYRYERGDPKSLTEAVQRALAELGQPDPEELRGATEPYSIEAWCQDLAQAAESLAAPRVQAAETVPERKRGIYCVAFGGPARKTALRMMESAKKYMPEIPICLAAAEPIGPEDIFLELPDSDVGGRRAKLQAYDNAPAEWESVLYLDVDTLIVAPIRLYFELIESGWEFVICKDPHLMDELKNFERRYNKDELRKTVRQVGTQHALQLNGGVWAFGRSERIKAFFDRWQEEWEKHAQRDQGALIRAMYADPLRMYVLGNEWNTFPKYMPQTQTAGLLHYPGAARRWRGQIPGRIDSDEAWEMVRAFERRHG